MNDTQVLLLAALPLIYAFLNRFRGSNVKDWIGINPPILKNGGPYAALATGLIFWYLSNDPIIGVGTAIAYFIGESFGWGKWIRAVQHFDDEGSWQHFYNEFEKDARDTGKSSGIHQIVSMVVKEETNYELYTVLCLILRGIWWWVPVYAVLVFGGLVTIPVAVISVLVIGLLFPVCYYAGSKMSRSRYIGWAEGIYGFVQGAVLSVGIYACL